MRDSYRAVVKSDLAPENSPLSVHGDSHIEIHWETTCLGDHRSRTEKHRLWKLGQGSLYSVLSKAL